MRMLGMDSSGLVAALPAWQGFAFWLVCDSDGDVTVVLGDDGEPLPEVRAFADRWSCLSDRVECGPELGVEGHP